MSVLYYSVWRYFDCPVETEARRKRVGISSERVFHILIFDMIYRYVEKHEGRIT